jgi:hypothetical protein
MDFSQADIDRFKSKYEIVESGCWEWTGALYQNGYGMACYRRGTRKTFLAHRISWSIFNSAPIPDRMMVCHTCDNRKCVNPSHLYVGTGKDNNSDTVNRNRGNRKVGNQCSWAKISESQVVEILQSNEKQVLLAKRYNVDQSTISQIKSGVRRTKYLSQNGLTLKFCELLESP